MDLSQRRFDLDWLRVIAILFVFIFHTTRFFDPLDWHVKNATHFQSLALADGFFVLWGMPLIFVISGASLWFAVKHSKLKFVDDKVRRLLVPLVVAIFTACALQVYLERITHHQFSGSFFDFFPHYFEGWYPWGNFAWIGMHLWYLFLLFAFSVLLMPLMYWLKNGSGRGFLQWLGDVLERPFLVYLCALPIMLLLIVLDPATLYGGPNFGGWSLVPYIVFLLEGFVIMSHEGAQKRIVQYRWLSLVIAAVATVWLIYMWQQVGMFVFGTTLYTVFYLVYGFASWCWIQTALGFGFKYLNAPRPILAYVGEAVLAFYILHQTVLLVVGYFVVQWQIPDLLKWAVIGVVSFTAIALLYEFLIRRFNVMRFLFGMRPLAKSAQPTPEVQGGAAQTAE